MCTCILAVAAAAATAAAGGSPVPATTLAREPTDVGVMAYEWRKVHLLIKVTEIGS